MSAYLDLARALETAASTRGKLAKIAALAGALRPLPESDLPAAARLLSGSPFAEWEQSVTSVGWATVARAASAVTSWDLETIGASARAIGDLGEAIGLLLPRDSAPEPPLEILEVDGRFRALAGLRRAAYGAPLGLQKTDDLDDGRRFIRVSHFDFPLYA